MKTNARIEILNPETGMRLEGKSVKECIVTVYIETPYGAFVPERKIIRANSFDSLDEILSMRGYKRYFIGSLLDEVVINN